jgi:hypothetical protein
MVGRALCTAKRNRRIPGPIIYDYSRCLVRISWLRNDGNGGAIAPGDDSFTLFVRSDVNIRTTYQLAKIFIILDVGWTSGTQFTEFLRFAYILPVKARSTDFMESVVDAVHRLTAKHCVPISIQPLFCHSTALELCLVLPFNYT